MVIAVGAAAILLCGPAFTTNARPTSVAGIDLPSGLNLTPGTIYGQVLDKDKHGISGATVTLYDVKVVGGDPLSNGLANVVDNPQVTASDGSYVFEGLSPGYYNITAEKDGHMWFAIANMTGRNSDGVKLNVALPDYLIRPSDEPSG